MKFCCESFEMHYLFRNTLAHSIRIVKFISPYMKIKDGIHIKKNSKWINVNKKGNNFNFLLMTAPYIQFDMQKNPALMIHYCPFCGINL